MLKRLRLYPGMAQAKGLGRGILYRPGELAILHSLPEIWKNLLYASLLQPGETSPGCRRHAAPDRGKRAGC